MGKRKTREAEENTKVVEEEARKMIAAAREKAAEEAMAMERITKSEAVATRHDEWTWMTTNAAEHDERTRTTNAVAAEDYDERTRTTSGRGRRARAAAAEDYGERTRDDERGGGSGGLRRETRDEHDDSGGETRDEHDGGVGKNMTRRRTQQRRQRGSNKMRGRMWRVDMGHREAPGAINLLSFRTDAAANATEKRMNLGGSLEVTIRQNV